MDGLVAYVLAKKIALGAVSGISNISIVDKNLVFKFKDGTSASMVIPTPTDGTDGKDGVDGVSILNVAVDENNHLICLLSNGKAIDAGEVPNPLVFVNSTDDLPLVGQVATLYVAGTEILIWDDNQYKKISSGGTGGSIQWGTF